MARWREEFEKAQAPGFRILRRVREPVRHDRDMARGCRRQARAIQMGGDSA